VYLRVPRFKVPEVTPEDAPLEPGRAVRLRAGDDVTIIAVGTMVSRALDAAGRLAADGIAACVLRMPFVDPLDEAAVLAAARETRGIVTVEAAHALA
jgi:transketolase